MSSKIVAYKFGDAESTEKRTFDFTIVFQVDDIMEYLDIVQRAPKKDYIFKCYDIFPRKGSSEKRMVGPHWVESCTFSRSNPQPEGRLQFDMKLKLRFIDDYDSGKAELAPWCYPVKDWTVSGAGKVLQLRTIYPPDSLTPIPFCNTAGTPLEATREVGISVISFTFNVKPGTVDENVVWGFKGTTNTFPILINGRSFPARTLLLDKYDLSQEEFTPSSSGDNNNDPLSLIRDELSKIEYTKVSVQMTFDPATYNQDYLNVGTMVWAGNSYEKLWRWLGRDDAQGAYYMHFGPFSYYQYALHSGNTYLGQDCGEEVTEPMFLNGSGTGISGFTGYQQNETYRTGCPFYPADWGYLQLPAQSGWRI